MAQPIIFNWDRPRRLEEGGGVLFENVQLPLSSGSGFDPVPFTNPPNPDKLSSRITTWINVTGVDLTPIWDVQLRFTGTGPGGVSEVEDVSFYSGKTPITIPETTELIIEYKTVKYFTSVKSIEVIGYNNVPRVPIRATAIFDYSLGYTPVYTCDLWNPNAIYACSIKVTANWNYNEKHETDPTEPKSLALIVPQYTLFPYPSWVQKNPFGKKPVYHTTDDNWLDIETISPPLFAKNKPLDATVNGDDVDYQNYQVGSLYGNPMTAFRIKVNDGDHSLKFTAAFMQQGGMF